MEIAEEVEEMARRLTWWMGELGLEMELITPGKTTLMAFSAFF